MPSVFGAYNIPDKLKLSTEKNKKPNKPDMQYGYNNVSHILNSKAMAKSKPTSSSSSANGKRKRISSPSVITKSTLASSSKQSQAKTKLYANIDDPKLYQRCEVMLERCEAADKAKVKLFNALLEEQRRICLQYRKQRSKSVDEPKMSLNRRKSPVNVSEKKTAPPTKPMAEKMRKTAPRKSSKSPTKRLKSERRASLNENRAQVNMETPPPPPPPALSEITIETTTTVHNSRLTNAVTADNNSANIAISTEHNMPNDINTSPMVATSNPTIPNETSQNAVAVVTANNNWVETDDSLLVPLVPKVVGRKRVRTRKSHAKTEMPTHTTNEAIQHAHANEKTVDNMNNVDEQSKSTMDETSSGTETVADAHAANATLSEKSNAVDDEPVEAAVAVDVAVAAAIAVVCSSITHENTDNVTADVSTPCEFATETAGAVNSLTLLADTAATTSPIPSNTGFSRNTIFVTPPVAMEVIVEQTTEQSPNLQSQPLLNADNANLIAAAVANELKNGAPCECVTQPQRLIEWSDLKNASEIKESNMPYLSLDAPLTVPAYLFNGESRDVPTPTLAATNDHEVSSTQETDCKMTRRNSNTTISKLTLMPSFTNAQCQDNQVGTTIYLPESSLLGKRTRKLSTPNVSTIHQRPGKKRRKTFCSESSVCVNVAESIYSTSVTSPSTTTTANTVPKTSGGRKRNHTMKIVTAAAATNDINLKKYDSPAFVEINPTVPLVPTHTYTKYSAAQEVFVPPDIEECLESDIVLEPVIESVNKVGKITNNHQTKSSKSSYNKITKNTKKKVNVNVNANVNGKVAQKKPDIKLKISRKNKKLHVVEESNDIIVPIRKRKK